MKRLSGKRGHHQYEPQQVLYLTGNINYTYLHLTDGEVILSCRTLKWFADQWPDFLRVHRNSLVNRRYVHAYQAGQTLSNYIVMTNQDCIEVARRRVAAVAELFLKVELPEYT